MEMSSFDKSAQTNPPSSLGGSPRKCNLSFSFNFDVDGIDSQNTTDSETPDLQIDVSEVDNYQKAKKRKYVEIDEASAINEMEEEIERQLDAKAAKTNLTATNVKNILKHVITNEHVLAMVQNSIHNTEEGAIFEPKLTRAKAKELAMAQPNIPWPMTPGKKPPPSEVQVLINEELSEDSSDEEYSPDQDQQSEDDGDHLTNSDIDSQPATPAAPLEAQGTAEPTAATDVHYDSEGVFKIPGIPHVPTEEESIGQRTRSKLSLSETPLEQIEQAFIPPDITTDMYDWDPDMDEEWNKFLKEFTQPLTHEPNNEDDPEADPEYNILEDGETDLLDKEELRADKAVKVSRKELNDLVAELFEFEDMFSKGQIQQEQQEQQEQQKKRKSAESCFTSVHNQLTDNTMVNLLPALAEPELPKIVSFEHSNLIAIQFQQHVQLMTQHFAMTYMHPQLHLQSKICKENLHSINILRTGDHSAFNVLNLPDALVLVRHWEEKLQDEKLCADYVNSWKEEIRKGEKKFKNCLKYIPKFHPELSKLLMESRALMYPELLPHVPPRCELLRCARQSYSKSEEWLLALGLDEFLPFHETKERKFSNRKMILMDAAVSISQYLMPSRRAKTLYNQINRRRAASEDNPIKYYFTNGYVPSRMHCVALENALKAPKDQPRSCLPQVWQEYLNNSNQKSSQSLMRALSESTDNIIIDRSLQTPVINMLPNMPNLDQTPQKRDTGVNPVDEDTDHSTENALVSPQLRQTTPRLAKIRSAQNMKLMTQVSGPKSLSSPGIKSRVKDDLAKATEDSSGSSKGDNEDEIAELMLASTTIKKDTVNRKKAKQARELENIKRLIEAETELGQEERMTKYAASCIQKVHVTLESGNPETLRAVIKLYSDYIEKIEGINQMSQESQDKLAIDFYKDICDILKDYSELCTDFLLFLKPHQAAIIGKSNEYTMLQKMSEFINVAQIYFAKQPSRMARIMQAITQLAADPNPTLDTVHAMMDPVLKGHPIVLDLFLQILPNCKPPESLFLSHLFENLTCPVGPYDKHKVYTEDSPELYENIELPTPTTQEDPYGGDNCKCICHDSNSPSKTSNADHCVCCGVRYLNGRVYLQTAEGLRPAKVTFPGDDEEKLENIARVSLKTTERFSPATSTGRRRKSSKNDASPDESLQKQCLPKASPTKENEESSSKSKRGGKSPPKYVDQRRLSKSSDVSVHSTTSAQSASDTSPVKSKREKRAERREAKSESKNLNFDLSKFAESPAVANESEDGASKPNRTDVNDDSYKIDNSDSDVNASEQVELESNKSDSDTTVDAEDSNKPWLRQDDALLLQNIQKDYSESTFVAVSEILGNRTVQQVKERCDLLLALLEKMV